MMALFLYLLAIFQKDSLGSVSYTHLMGIEHVAVEKAVAYIDHNMLQTGFEMCIRDSKDAMSLSLHVEKKD